MLRKRHESPSGLSFGRFAHVLSGQTASLCVLGSVFSLCAFMSCGVLYVASYSDAGESSLERRVQFPVSVIISQSTGGVSKRSCTAVSPHSGHIQRHASPEGVEGFEKKKR